MNENGGKVPVQESMSVSGGVKVPTTGAFLSAHCPRLEAEQGAAARTDLTTASLR